MPKKKQKKSEQPSFIRVFSKRIVVLERSAVKNSFGTYVWIEVDSCFCEALYVQVRSNHEPFRNLINEAKALSNTNKTPPPL